MPSSFPKLRHLDGLDECVEEDPDADGPAEQLDEPGGAEQPQEANVDDPGGVNDAADHRDEVKGVPRVFEVRLERRGECRVSV